MAVIDTYIVHDEDIDVLKTYFMGHDYLWAFQNNTGDGQDLNGELLYGLGPNFSDTDVDTWFYFLYNNKVYGIVSENNDVVTNVKKEAIDPDSLGIKEVNGQNVLVTASATLSPSEYTPTGYGAYYVPSFGYAIFDSNARFYGYAD